MSTATHSQSTERLALPAREAAKMLGISERHLWACAAKGGGFPQPVKVGGRCSRWIREDLIGYLESLKRGEGGISGC